MAIVTLKKLWQETLGILFARFPCPDRGTETVASIPVDFSDRNLTLLHFRMYNNIYISYVYTLTHICISISQRNYGRK